jgi:hypothetical protein
MIRKLPSLAVALLVAAGACGRGADHNADTALNNDLSLAAQAKAYQPLDSMSAAERGLNGTPAAAPPDNSSYHVEWRSDAHPALVDHELHGIVGAER